MTVEEELKIEKLLQAFKQYEAKDTLGIDRDLVEDHKAIDKLLLEYIGNPILNDTFCRIRKYYA